MYCFQCTTSPTPHGLKFCLYIQQQQLAVMVFAEPMFPLPPIIISSPVGSPAVSPGLPQTEVRGATRHPEQQPQPGSRQHHPSPQDCPHHRSTGISKTKKETKSCIFGYKIDIIRWGEDVHALEWKDREVWGARLVGPVHVIQLPVSLRLDTRSCVCVHDQGAHNHYQVHVQANVQVHIQVHTQISVRLNLQGACSL